MPSVRNTLHGAGNPNDSAIAHQQRQTYAAVYMPKYYVAWHLNRLSMHTTKAPGAITFFSSAAGFLGSPGQSNYSAAHAGLDALAAFRVSLELPGTSINWSDVAEVCDIARHGVTQENLMTVA